MSVDHYENFPVASVLLPKRLRRPVAAIYHFARSADDIADEGDLPDEERLRQLDQFRAELIHIARNEPPLTLLFQTLAAEIRQHALPLQPFYDLLDAFSQDVVTKRYADFPDLLDYCRSSTSGRMSRKITRSGASICRWMSWCNTASARNRSRRASATMRGGN
jgi:phytoene/squalene synthetase